MFYFDKPGFNRLAFSIVRTHNHRNFSVTFLGLTDNIETLPRFLINIFRCSFLDFLTVKIKQTV